MKRETILKTMLILIMGAILFTIPVNVFASEATDLDEFWEDQGGLEDIGGGETTDTPTETPEQTPSNPSTGNTTGTTQEDTYSDAGLAEDTIMVVTIAGLVVLAVVAYKKVNEYQSI